MDGPPDQAFERAWSLRATALALWAVRPLLDAFGVGLDPRVEFAGLGLLTLLALVASARSRRAPAEKALDAVVSLAFLVYFGGWLAWLLAPAAGGPPAATDPLVIRAATAGGLLALAWLTPGRGASRAPWALAAGAWIADLPPVHQQIFLRAPQVATLLASIGVLAALVAVQVMVSARRPAPAA